MKTQFRFFIIATTILLVGKPTYADDIQTRSAKAFACTDTICACQEFANCNECGVHLSNCQSEMAAALVFVGKDSIAESLGSNVTSKSFQIADLLSPRAYQSCVFFQRKRGDFCVEPKSSTELVNTEVFSEVEKRKEAVINGQKIAQTICLSDSRKRISTCKSELSKCYGKSQKRNPKTFNPFAWWKTHEEFCSSIEDDMTAEGAITGTNDPLKACIENFSEKFAAYSWERTFENQQIARPECSINQKHKNAMN